MVSEGVYTKTLRLTVISIKNSQSAQILLVFIRLIISWEWIRIASVHIPACSGVLHKEELRA